MLLAFDSAELHADDTPLSNDNDGEEKELTS
jgi:hypothetical protein